MHRDEREILAGSRAEYWIFQKVNKRGLIIKVNKYSLPLKLFQDFQFSTFRAALSLFTALCWRTHTRARARVVSYMKPEKRCKKEEVANNTETALLKWITSPPLLLPPFALTLPRALPEKEREEKKIMYKISVRAFSFLIDWLLCISAPQGIERRYWGERPVDWRWSLEKQFAERVKRLS